jgi:hypothetical protein
MVKTTPDTGNPFQLKGYVEKLMVIQKEIRVTKNLTNALKNGLTAF